MAVFRVETEIRIVNDETGEVVDNSGYTDMRGKVRSAKPFFPMSAIIKMRGFDDTVAATSYMNTLYNALNHLKEIK